MAEPSLSRIPFRPEDEVMISSMAVWMRFIGAFTILAGILLLFGVLLLLALFSTVQHFEDSGLEQFHRQLQGGGVPLAGLGVVVLVLSGMTIWAGMALYQAGENFTQVATTDVADQEYLARGLDKLRLFFKLEVLKAALAVIMVVFLVMLLVMIHHRS